MLSKYPLDRDFFDIPDSKAPSESTLLLRIGNILLKRNAKKVKADGIKVREEKIRFPGYNGKKIKARFFSPTDADEKLPCILNFHGGAFVGEGMPHQVNYCLNFAEQLKCKVMFVEYRVAIDHPFPTPVEDCYAALEWVYKNSEKLGVDTEKVAVFGDSAGGSLAAAVCHMAKDRAIKMPCFQMLIYPVTDSGMSTESAKKYVDVPEFNALGNKLMWKLYLKNGDFGTPQYAAPLLADSFAGLPAAYVETAQFDCLHDEGVAYAEKLKAAGVEVTLNETKGSYHGFDIHMEKKHSKHMLAERTEILRKAFYG